ncbi:MAG TPA: gamma-glutamyltransferase [Mariprofundaceae bacterium]|nr:gamma-glutamyltransferase [Mariprofundaceae bacterium]
MLTAICKSSRLKYALPILLLLPWSAQAARPAHGMVVSAEKLATAAGIEMLERGGNAFDAAAATALAIGVAEPESSGIGGGGFFLLYIAKEHRYVMLDARETSPQLAGHGEIYQTRSSIDGPQSAGVPGLIAGVDRLISRYGKLDRKEIVAPAVRIARDGFEATPRYRMIAGWRKDVLNTNQAGRIYLHDGEVPEEGSLIRQPALAETLARFADRGADDFYRGETAGRLVADLKRDGGLLRLADLASYRAIERQPVEFDAKGFHVVTASLPSSGGLTLAEIFGMLKHDDLKALKLTDRDHLLIEAMKRAYRDRNRNLGDADFVHLPKDYLAQARLQKLRRSIDMQHATPSAQLNDVAEPAYSEPMGAGTDTTHFCVIDRDGNMVSATLSINYGFGSGYVSPATGILLNDEMDDFATQAGKPNAYGLVQGTANGVAPGKRMLSSMTPTIVIGPQRTFIVGTPGGSRIISMVLEAMLGFMLDETLPADWIAQPRFHHQFLPDEVQFEAGAFTDTVAGELRRRGQVLKQVHDYGDMQAILWQRDSGRLTGLADPRGEGVAVESR